MVMLKQEIIVILLESIEILINIDCNIQVKLNHELPILFHNVKNYGSYLIMQDLGKFDFKRTRSFKTIYEL